MVTEAQPRIKFQCLRQGDCEPLSLDTPGLQDLIQLCQRMEELGAAPVLNDGLVGGNAGILVDAPGISSSCPTLFVTRSGKPPALHMGPSDFVAVTGFDEAEWSATYRSSNPDYRPSSDTPLLFACLSGSSAARHHWSSQPRVALHGHALAAGAGLDAARGLQLPISEHATLFSTPPDLQELEALLAAHPFPAQRCFIRRGHGFFILGEDVGHAEQTLEQLVVPHLIQQQAQAQQARMQ